MVLVCWEGPASLHSKFESSEVCSFRWVSRLDPGILERGGLAPPMQMPKPRSLEWGSEGPPPQKEEEEEEELAILVAKPPSTSR